jgi:hypothetical protein
MRRENRPDEGRAGCRSAKTPAALCACCLEAHRRDLPSGDRQETGIPRAAIFGLLRETPGGLPTLLPTAQSPDGPQESRRPRTQGTARRCGLIGPRVRRVRDHHGLGRRARVANPRPDAAPPLRLVERLRKTPLAASGSALEFRGGGKRGDNSAHPHECGDPDLPVPRKAGCPPARA